MTTTRVFTQFATILCLLNFSVAGTTAQIFDPHTSQAEAQGVQQASASLGNTDGTRSSRWPSMPKVTMPKMTMPKMTMPDMSGIMMPVKSGYNKMAAGTKKAWAGTKEMLSFGQSQARSHRAATPKPSFWHRLVGRAPEPKGPQTIGEFMSQPRLDP